MPHLPYQGEYKQLSKKGDSGEADEYEVFALAKRLGITSEEMKEMSFVSLMNILISSVDDEDKTKSATQSDIDRMFG